MIISPLKQAFIDKMIEIAVIKAELLHRLKSDRPDKRALILQGLQQVRVARRVCISKYRELREMDT